MRSYSNTRCRACGGRIERPAAEDAEIARLRARLALAERIVHIARFWAAHDAGLFGAIKEWEAL